MAGNKNLNSAARAKNDEFYTQYDDIQRELNCYYLYDKNFLRGKTVLLPCDDPQWSNFTKFFALNFTRYGLKKLISTGYAADKKKFVYKPMKNLFDDNDAPQFNPTIDAAHGRIYTLDADDIAKVDYPLDALTNWRYLDGDGDFRSEEVKRLRDEADVIITNPPFSMFREFLAWIVDAGKQFLIIGNKNCITYKEVFPLIMQNKIWVGGSPMSREFYFDAPKEFIDEALANEKNRTAVFYDGRHMVRSPSIWLTNLDHGKRHEPLNLMTYAECERFHPKVRDTGFQRYDNYDAIEVPATDAIPKDFGGVMGVPITFLDKYCPEQFEIVGCTYAYGDFGGHKFGTPWGAKIDGNDIYKRLFIRHRR